MSRYESPLPVASRYSGLFLTTTNADQKLSTNTFAFTNIAVIDVVSGRATTEMTVTVSDGESLQWVNQERCVPPTNAQIINASGKFLIPGPWDMHVHPSDKGSLPLFIANAISGVRVMFGNAEYDQQRINTVVVNGRLLDRAALDGMLSQAETAAASQKEVK